MKTSLQIASEARIAPIRSMAERLGIPDRFFEQYGRWRERKSQKRKPSCSLCSSW